MDQDLLVTSAIDEGRRLLEELDNIDYIITSAFWYFNSDTNDWKLYMASPYIDTQGPTIGYSRIQDLIHKMEFSTITLMNIVVVSPDYGRLKY